MNWLNLYVQTEYSLLKSSIRIPELKEFAKANNFRAMAICDENMAGVFKFYLSAIKANIKPIIGLKVNIHTFRDVPNTILLFCKDNIGYQNLLYISSIQEIEPSKLTLDFLLQYNQGLIGVIPSDENELYHLLINNDLAAFKKVFSEYKTVFPSIFFGLDLQTEQAHRNFSLVYKTLQSLNIPCVALHKTNYLVEDDFEVYLTLRQISEGPKYQFSLKEANSSYLTSEEAISLYKQYPELISNLDEIIMLCNIRLDIGTFKMPQYDLPGKDSFTYLSQLCKVGLNKRLQNKSTIDVNVYRKRLLYELDIIKKMGFTDYFLIVYDFVKYAKKNGIMVGAGRGSAPGSLISYSLGITEVDPIEHDLLFERFLNPERISMPDIDIDFADNKRDLVIRYLGEKYGKDHVAHISTFGRYAARMSIRDVARAKEISPTVLNEVLKYFPALENSLDKIYESSPMIQKIVQENDEARILFNLARRIEGQAKHISTHAAGIIITDKPLTYYTALREGMNGIYQTQFEAEDLEAIGLVKIDLLALRNLTIIDDTLNKINQQYRTNLTLNDIPFNDKKTFQLISEGNTTGVFQLESSGMRNVLRKLRVSQFIDIVHANALYRPGPREMIDTFVRRKFGQEKVEYLHQDLEPILKSTYGIIVFQEQIMLIAQKFAGYSLGMADILRRAISKKDAQVLQQERDRFVKSAKQRGYDEQIGHTIYDYIVKFADYGFNKNHAVAYSMISYQMAYLKTHYFMQFMTSLLDQSLGSHHTLSLIINECRKENVYVLNPSVNNSDLRFVIVNNKIYYSLLGILGIGYQIASAIVNERKENGLYRDYVDFIARTKDFLNQRLFENLVFSGALDEFGLTKKQMIEDYENTLHRVNYIELFSGQLIPNTKRYEEYSFAIVSEKEREVLGFNLKYNIFRLYDHEKQKMKAINISELKVGQYAKILAAVNKITKIKTKNNDEMAFIDLYDETDQISAVCFPSKYLEIIPKISEESIYIFDGKCDTREGKKQYILENVYMLK